MRLPIRQLVIVACLFIGIIRTESGRLLENDCGTTISNGYRARIDGGRDAGMESNPWMVRVMISGKAVCGGSLITARKYLELIIRNIYSNYHCMFI